MTTQEQTAQSHMELEPDTGPATPMQPDPVAGRVALIEADIRRYGEQDIPAANLVAQKWTAAERRMKSRLAENPPSPYDSFRYRLMAVRYRRQYCLLMGQHVDGKIQKLTLEEWAKEELDYEERWRASLPPIVMYWRDHHMVTRSECVPDGRGRQWQAVIMSGYDNRKPHPFYLYSATIYCQTLAFVGPIEAPGKFHSVSDAKAWCESTFKSLKEGGWSI